MARSHCGRKAQAISVRGKVKQIDRYVRICKCPVGTDLKEIFERVYFTHSHFSIIYAWKYEDFCRGGNNWV